MNIPGRRRRHNATATNASPNPSPPPTSPLDLQRHNVQASPVIVGSAGSIMTVELEVSSSESPSDFETTAEDLLLMSTSYNTATADSFSPSLSTPQVLHHPQQIQEHQDLDMQGIPWARANISREEFRVNRIVTYQQYEVERGYQTNINVELFDDSSTYYEFKHMNRFEGCSVQHFQLKHLVHCPTPMSLFFPLYNRVKRLQPLRSDVPSTTELNLSERFGVGFSRISSMIVTEDVGLVGGLFGELVVWRWGSQETPSSLHLDVISTDPANSVVNHLSQTLMEGVFSASCNDGHLRLYDVHKLQTMTEWSISWPINASHAHPVCASLIAIVGDAPETLLIDSRSKGLIIDNKLSGHDDCSFSVAWRPDGLHLATANQDRTVIVRDIRMLNKQVSRRRSLMSVPRSLKYHPDGSLLAIATADDYVHIVDSQSYNHGQVIDFFGDIAGMDFGIGLGLDRLYIGCANPNQGGIISFERQQIGHNNTNNDPS